jgi:hypothetical protein
MLNPSIAESDVVEAMKCVIQTLTGRTRESWIAGMAGQCEGFKNE